MSEILKPRLDDLRFSYSMISDTEVIFLPSRAFFALMQLVRFSAAGIAWTYSPPSDGSLPGNDSTLAKLAMVSPNAWPRVRAYIEPFFKIRKGRWHLDRPWVSINESRSRPAIPREAARRAIQREGRRCSYCGDAAGPFDLDHIYPVIKGGSDDPSNLALACVPCNRSKGAKTLREWMASRG